MGGGRMFYYMGPVTVLFLRTVTVAYRTIRYGANKRTVLLITLCRSDSAIPQQAGKRSFVKRTNIILTRYSLPITCTVEALKFWSSDEHSSSYVAYRPPTPVALAGDPASSHQDSLALFPLSIVSILRPACAFDRAKGSSRHESSGKGSDCQKCSWRRPCLLLPFARDRILP